MQGIYKRSQSELKRIRSLRCGLVPWNKGRPWSEEVKDKLRKKALNRKGYWLGKTRPMETRLKISETRKLRKCGIGSKNPFWKGGKRKNRTHIQVKIGNRYYYEHRVVMEKLLGRKLKSTEIVHHKDGNGANNDPKNLELMKNQSEHVRKYPTLTK